jgi:hypothetical protein
MSFFDLKFDNLLHFHFDELLILFTFFVFKLMFGKPWKKLSRPKKVFRFSDFHCKSVHINNRVLLWLQIRWSVTFSLWWIADFVYFFYVFKLMFGKPWKKLSRPKKVFRFFDFHCINVHINNHVLLWLQIRCLVTFHLNLMNCWFCLLFFLSSNWCLASHGKSYQGPKRYLDFLFFTLTVFI